MTKEEFKSKLKEHHFSSYGEFLDLVEDEQRMSCADKYSMLREEYDADKAESEARDDGYRKNKSNM